MIYNDIYDVIVVGGGHAGTEAALAPARMGLKTLLLTHNVDTLGQMSCNPAIGGIGKGHLVKEIDAMGGLMAIATDQAGIQFRTLNSSKGPAVRATRAQADRVLYRNAVRTALENQLNLDIFQQEVVDILIENNRAVGAITKMGLVFKSRSVILTAGTFLAGKIHIGLEIVKHLAYVSKNHNKVEFNAFFKTEEDIQAHNEISLFVKINQRWFFVDPTVPLPNQKQNCLCGSGKKFKHCCGYYL